MAYRTGNTRTLTAGGSLAGAVKWLFFEDQANAGTCFLAFTSFSISALGCSAGGVPSLDGNERYTGDTGGDIFGIPTWTVTASAPGGASDFGDFYDNVTKPGSEITQKYAPYSLGVGGSWEASADVEECFEFTSAPAPWHRNVPDAPPVSYIRFFERYVVGSTRTITITSGGVSSTSSGTVTAPPAEASYSVSVDANGANGPDQYGFGEDGDPYGQTITGGPSVLTVSAGTGLSSSGFPSDSGTVGSLSFTGGVAKADIAKPTGTYLLGGGPDPSFSDFANGNAHLDILPDKAVSIAGSILEASGGGYPDALEFAIAGIPGTTLASGSSSFSASGIQREWNAFGTISWPSSYSEDVVTCTLGADEYGPVSASITPESLKLNGEDYVPDSSWPGEESPYSLESWTSPRITRLLIQGETFAGISLSHDGSSVIAGAFPSAAASITKTYSPEIPADSYTYLRLSVRSNGAGSLPARVTIPPCSEGVASNETDVYAGSGTPSKSWDFQTGAEGVYVDIDVPLFSPDNLSADTDAHDGQYPYPVRKSAYDGVWRIGEITVALTGTAGSNTIEVQSVTLRRPGAIAATWLPTFQHSLYRDIEPSLTPEWPSLLQLGPDRQISESETTSYDYARRFLYARADGMPVLEEWDFGYTRTVGGVSGITSYNFITRSIQGLCDAINGNVSQYDSGGTLAGSVRLHPGWTAAPGVPAPSTPYVDRFVGDFPLAYDYFYNADLPAVGLAAAGVQGMDGGLSPAAWHLYDSIDGYPGCEWNDAVCGAVLRGTAQGLLLTEAPATGSPDRKGAASGKTVTLTQTEDIPVGGTDETGQTRGTATSGADGWYSTGSPAGRAGNVSHEASPESEGTAPTLSFGGSSWLARRRHTGTFIVVPAGTPGRSPRGLNTNRGGYYGTVLIRGEAKHGRVQWRRTAGEQVPRSNVWAVTAYVSTPGTDEGDAEPWPWYEPRDSSLHVLYTRGTYDPMDADPEALPTATAIREAVSFDDGATWTETEVSTVARHPHAMVEPGGSGGTLRAWFVPDGTDPTIGTIVGTWQAAGDASPSAPFTFQYDATGLTDMVVQDDVFGITYGYESQGRYNLIVMFDTDTSPSNWHSSDDGRTWTRVV